MTLIPNYAGFPIADDDIRDQHHFVHEETALIRMLGYADTIYGYMAVFECVECGDKWRDFISDNPAERADFGAFKIQYEAMKRRFA